MEVLHSLSFVYFFVLAIQQVLTKGSLPKYYMSELCDQTLYTSSQRQPAGRVELVRRGDYRDNMNCVWTISAPANHYLMIRFKDLDIDRRFFKCNDYLQIYDNNRPSGNFLSGVSKLCGESHPRHPIYTTGNAMTLRFVSDSRHDDDGFDLYFNVYHKGKCNDSDEFRCDNGHCINKSLQCNGYNNCGDDSDFCTNETASIIGIIIAVIFILVVIVVVVFICRRKRQKSGRTFKANNDVPMTTTYAQPQMENQQPYTTQGQGYPPQGYPPQGYPPQGQGYPPQAQGYPPQAQGYPPQGQGYPPQGQGYPQYYGYGSPGGPDGYPQGGQYPQSGQYPPQYPPPQGPDGNVPAGAPPPYPGPPKEESNFSKVPL